MPRRAVAGLRGCLARGWITALLLAVALSLVTAGPASAVDDRDEIVVSEAQFDSLGLERTAQSEGGTDTEPGTDRRLVERESGERVDAVVIALWVIAAVMTVLLGIFLWHTSPRRRQRLAESRSAEPSEEAEGDAEPSGHLLSPVLPPVPALWSSEQAQGDAEQFGAGPGGVGSVDAEQFGAGPGGVGSGGRRRSVGRITLPGSGEGSGSDFVARVRAALVGLRSRLVPQDHRTNPRRDEAGTPLWLRSGATGQKASEPAGDDPEPEPAGESVDRSAVTKFSQQHPEQNGEERSG